MPKTGSFMVPHVSGGTGPNEFKDPGITDPPESECGTQSGAVGFSRRKGRSQHLSWSRNFQHRRRRDEVVSDHGEPECEADVFNVTNTPRFDVGTMNLAGNTILSSSSSFGNFNSTLSNAWVMELAVRYSF